MRRYLTLLLATLLLGGCCSTCRWRVKHAKPLEGTTWHLVQIGGTDHQLPDDSFNIILAEGHLSGRGACNSLLGQYTTEGKSGIRFTHLGSTRMLCPKNEHLETALAQTLNRATHYDIDYDSLMLLEDGSIIAIFKALDNKQ